MINILSSSNSNRALARLAASRTSVPATPAPASFSTIATAVSSPPSANIGNGASVTDFTFVVSWTPIPGQDIVIIDIPVLLNNQYQRNAATDTGTLDHLVVLGPGRLDATVATLTISPSTSTSTAFQTRMCRIRYTTSNTGSLTLTLRYTASAASFLAWRLVSVTPTKGACYVSI